MRYFIRDYKNLQELFDSIPNDDMDVCIDGDYSVYDLQETKIPAPINNRRISIKRATFKVVGQGHGIRPHDSVSNLSADHSWAGGGIAAMLQTFHIHDCNFFGGGSEHTQLTIAGAHVGSTIERCFFGNSHIGGYQGIGTPSKHLQIIFGMGVSVKDNRFQFARHDSLVIRSGQNTISHLNQIDSSLVTTTDDGGWFSDVTGGNSMSNNCIVENNRFFAQPNQQFDIRIMGSDMVEMRGNVHEGANAFCRVLVHGQASPNVNTVRVDRFWGEGLADRVQILAIHVPTVEIGTILSQHRSNLIETENVATVLIDNIAHMQAGHTPWFVNNSSNTKYIINHAKQGRGVLSGARWAGQNTKRALFSPDGINAAGTGGGYYIQRGVDGARVLFGGEIEIRNISAIRMQNTFPLFVRVDSRWRTINNWW